MDDKDKIIEELLAKVAKLEEKQKAAPMFAINGFNERSLAPQEQDVLSVLMNTRVATYRNLEERLWRDRKLRIPLHSQSIIRVIISRLRVALQPTIYRIGLRRGIGYYLYTDE